ncbi:PREDICTED: transcriptional enhancer factor TEF-3-like [Acropora digitifera]|uniref:transcriptional enhancer factor TEF-3-like n=1 Tax=Acropora digitifera TaxID=70779 RepID=UPI00077A6099|nr:PREDICTED: transcriptional enhancer factor TEF-3-like [Acropora digitifera]
MANSVDEGNSAKSPVDMANDAEGVWSPDIEQSFQEALAIYPPCGRRKIILSDEGKMYGRNELIARYIKLRTGKTRTRKQVSSHIQVLARKKAREIQGKLKDQAARDKALQTMASMSSAQIVSASVLHNKALAAQGMPPATYNNESQGYQQQYWQSGATAPPVPSNYNNASQSMYGSPGVQATVPGNVVSTASVASPTGAVVSSPDDLRSASYTSGAVSSTPPTFAAHGSSSWPPRTAVQEHQHLVSKMAHIVKDEIIYYLTLLYLVHAYQKYNIKLDVSLCIKALESILNSFSVLFLRVLFVNPSSLSWERISKGNLELFGVWNRIIIVRMVDQRIVLLDPPECPQAVFFLVKFWADLNTNIHDEAGAFYGVSSTYESNENMTITCSSKVCSFGKQVVEKVETEYGHYENNRFVYRIHRSPMCEYMINFVHKLKQLPEKYMMNSVLENFTILQVVSNRETQETLLCLAYVFEVSTSEHGAQHHIYRLVKD